MTYTPTFFSRTAPFVIGALLLFAVLGAVYMVGPAAIERWFR